jgi:hypothetical protein
MIFLLLQSFVVENFDGTFHRFAATKGLVQLSFRCVRSTNNENAVERNGDKIGTIVIYYEKYQ